MNWTKVLSDENSHELGRKTQIKNIYRRHICDSNKTIWKTVFFSSLETFEDASQFCTSLGGRILQDWKPHYSWSIMAKRSVGGQQCEGLGAFFAPFKKVRPLNDIESEWEDQAGKTYTNINWEEGKTIF